MGLLGKPLGFFSLRESDKYVGSYIHKDDVKAILGVSDDDLKDVEFKTICGDLYIDESTLRKKYWEKGLIPNSVPWKKGNSIISLDEYILIAIIKDTYPDAKVTSQYKWGRKYIDIYVENANSKFFIEFHGPGHFKKMSIYKDPENPFIRKKAIEQEFGYPCYIWPYWIQRCKKNLQIMLGDIDNNIQGLGALWSTKVFFGEFFFDNSAEIIDTITRQFNAAPNGYGYFYEKWNLENGIQKEEHPILESIRKKRKNVNVLIPKGVNSQSDINYWIPGCLENLLEQN